MIGSLIYGAVIGDAVIRIGTHTGATVRAYNAQIFAQAMIGTFLAILGRGAITWIALQDQAGQPVTGRLAVIEALRRWQPLLLGAALYGTLITLGLIGLTALLRELRLDVSSARMARGNMESMLYWTLTRAIAALPPEAGSPFSDWLALARYNLSRAGSNMYLSFELSGYATRTASPQIWGIGLASIALLIVTETLLCMRSAAAFASRGAFGWLGEALRVSGAHFWRVLAWRWTLRLVIVAVTIGALVLLPALHQGLVMNAVRRALGLGYWPYHIAQSAYGLGIALVSGVLIAFSVAFEAHMYIALARMGR
jgi:hypothetical protein